MCPVLPHIQRGLDRWGSYNIDRIVAHVHQPVELYLCLVEVSGSATRQALSYARMLRYSTNAGIVLVLAIASDIPFPSLVTRRDGRSVSLIESPDTIR